MWDFLSDVLREGGLVATLFFIMLFGCGAVVRAQLKQAHSLNERIADLQEKRLSDALRMHGQMVKHVESVDQAMSRLSASLDVLIRLIGREG